MQSSEIQPGAVHRVRIDDVAFGGEGVARLNDFVVFVPFVIPGETAEVEITEVKRNFARARLLRVTEPSPDRVHPPCPYFGDCGGCQFQHLRYERQLQLKQKQLGDLLQRIGGLGEGLVDPVIPSPREYGYRNRIMVRTQWDKFKQALNFGFIRFDNRLVVDIEECRIAEPELNAALRHARAHPPPKGGLKVTLRMEAEGWEVPPHSFFQNNFHAAPLLLDAVRARLREGGCRFLVDVYCGVGYFSIQLGDQVERFVGIESDQAAIAAARRNAQRHGCAHGEYIAGLAEEIIGSVLGRFTAEHTALLIDPPRRGCAPETIAAIAQYRPAQVIYVSCEPATLARDLKLLCAAGSYRLQRVTPVDMFPQTAHLEAVADVRRNE